MALLFLELLLPPRHPRRRRSRSSIATAVAIAMAAPGSARFALWVGCRCSSFAARPPMLSLCSTSSCGFRPPHFALPLAIARRQRCRRRRRRRRRRRLGASRRRRRRRGRVVSAGVGVGGSVAHSLCSAPVKEGRLQPLHLHGVPLSPLRRGQPQLRTDLVRPVVQSIVHVDMSVETATVLNRWAGCYCSTNLTFTRRTTSTKSQHFTTSKYCGANQTTCLHPRPKLSSRATD